MPGKTTTLNLNKPLGSEVVDIDVLNENMDILDTTVKDVQDFMTQTEADLASAEARITALDNAATGIAAEERKRVTAESNRVTAEDTRIANETGRVSAEQARVTAENQRAAAETARAAAEANRVSAETAREQVIEDFVDTTDANKKDAEAYAVGTRGGTDVPDTDPTYHNNAKYYAGQASADAETAEAAKTTAVTTVETAIGNIRTEGTTQVSAVQTKGDEVLASIPDDYEALSTDVSALKSETDSLKIEVDTKADAIEKTVSGDIVTFDDAIPDTLLKTVKVNIEPVQSGTGDPSPDNIRPITGWTGVNIRHYSLPVGYHACDYIKIGAHIDIEFGSFNNNLVFVCEFSCDDFSQYGNIFRSYVNESTNATRIIIGTTSYRYLLNCNSRADSSTVLTVNSIRSFNKVTMTHAYYKLNNNDWKPMTTAGGSANTNTSLQIGNDNVVINMRSFIIRDINSLGGTQRMCLIPCTNPDGIAGLYDLVTNNFYTADDTSKVVAVGSPTWNSEILGNNYSVTFPTEAGDNGTVYDGELTLNDDGTGELVNSWHLFDISGTGSWPIIGTNGDYTSRYKNFSFPIAPTGAASNDLCNMLKPVDAINATHLPDFPAICLVRGTSGYIRITLPTAEADSSDKVNAWLTNHEVKVLYQMATPDTFTLSTAPQIKTLLGENNIFADTGDVEVTYRQSAEVSIRNLAGEVTDEKLAEIEPRHPHIYTATLTADNWVDNKQTVEIEVIDADETKQIIEPIPANASLQAYTQAGVMAINQYAGQLEFSCNSVPTDNLTVYVVVTEVMSE